MLRLLHIKVYIDIIIYTYIIAIYTNMNTYMINIYIYMYIDDIPLRVRLEAFSDGTYHFTVHPPMSSWLLKRAAGVEKGAATTGTQVVGTVHAKHLYHIAQIKQKYDNNAYMNQVSIESIVRQLVGQCGSMGIKIDCSRTDKSTADTTATQQTTTKQ